MLAKLIIGGVEGLIAQGVCEHGRVVRVLKKAYCTHRGGPGTIIKLVECCSGDLDRCSRASVVVLPTCPYILGESSYLRLKNVEIVHGTR